LAIDLSTSGAEEIAKRISDAFDASFVEMLMPSDRPDHSS
jgi:hypothetical protein